MSAMTPERKAVITLFRNRQVITQDNELTDKETPYWCSLHDHFLKAGATCPKCDEINSIIDDLLADNTAHEATIQSRDELVGDLVEYGSEMLSFILDHDYRHSFHSYVNCDKDVEESITTGKILSCLDRASKIGGGE